MAKKGTKEAAAKILLNKGWTVGQVFDVLELDNVRYTYSLPVVERWWTHPYHYWSTGSITVSDHTDVLSFSGSTSANTICATAGYAEVIS